jgi:tetratricopeptide (TPR) repeat protein
MSRWAGHRVAAGVLAAVVATGGIAARLVGGSAPAAGATSRPSGRKLEIRYPQDGTLFPPEFSPPTFRWTDGQPKANAWRISVEPGTGGTLTFRTSRPQWQPAAAQWDAIKKAAVERDARVRIEGLASSAPGRTLSTASVAFRTSKDEVGAPIFYREVNLPFIDAVKDPRNIRWRYGAVSLAERPPVILAKLPVCGNCHSFTADGRMLAMDVDYANSKGSYVITRVAREMRLATSDIITWNDFRRADGEQTFGLLSQISPDGRFVVSTVKDKSVFVPQPGLWYSQLFFPVKGILAYYRRDRKTFHPLPGADDPKYCQSNPTWSPDGKEIVFARATAYDLKHTKGKGKVLLTREECKEFTEDRKPFRFSLYRIPFNEGRGGRAVPIPGASHNGKSNYFARYSPDGKWIIFCIARSYMLLQPDAELYVIPAEGGRPRRLRCNLPRMNSWHSFSPNGRWLVFSSKANTAYTQLFLTHVDEAGRTTPPVLLEHFTEPDGAANIPEFVNARPDAIAKIREEFLNDHSFVRAADQFFRRGEADGAILNYRKALELNPYNVEAHRRLGFLLYHVRPDPGKAMAHLEQALRLAPGDGPSNYEMGMVLLHQRKFAEAARHLIHAVKAMPDGLGLQYKPVEMRYNLARALTLAGNPKAAGNVLSDALRRDPKAATVHYYLAFVLTLQGQTDAPAKHCATAVRLDRSVDRMPFLHEALARNYAAAGRFDRAVASATHALGMARARRDRAMAARIEASLAAYKQKELPGAAGLGPR